MHRCYWDRPIPNFISRTTWLGIAVCGFGISYLWTINVRRVTSRYYLHRRLRRAGFRLTSNKVGKTIDVKADQIMQARDNKYIAELRDTHNYAVQYINPVMML